ncbi:hypothetical protein Gotur_012688 [Gossypium turneri]
MLKEESWNPKYELWKKALLTNAERAKHGLAEDPSCPICGHASEDILHVTRNCTLAKEASKHVADVEIKSTRGERLAGEWNYLNTDGAVRVDSGVAAAGGVLRDKNREGDAKVVIQSDNLKAVKAIHRSVLKTSHSALIRRIHLILSQESSWLLSYIHKKQNLSANFIAKLAFGEKEDL